MAAAAAATGAYPLLIQHAFDLFAAADPAIIWSVPPLILAATCVRGILLYLQAGVVARAALAVIERIQGALFDHLLAADLAQVTGAPSGGLIARFTHDVGVIRAALTSAITTAARDALTVVALVAAMLALDWQLALFALLIYPLAAIPIQRIGRRLRRVSAETQGEVGRLTGFLRESLAGARTVRAFRLEAQERARARAFFARLTGLTFRAVEGRARLDPSLEVLGGAAVALVIGFGGWRVVSGAGTVGDFTGFVSALLMAAQPVRALGALNAQAAEGMAALERVFALLDERPRVVDLPDARPLARPVRGRIELRHVRFAHPGAARPALDGVSFRVEPGETVALVGRSGAGKSTIFTLLPRFADVAAGQVLVDGRDVRDVTLASLRDAMALVTQDIVLWDDTVAANLRLGRPDASDAALQAAAEAAALADVIARLPQGWATKLGEGGHTLSGGERQRLALARALVKDAPILLLDEATSALDAESEARIQDALARVTAGRTVLVIAHRLSTVRRANRIVVLDGGRVVEQGTHEALLAADGLYASLCRMQFRPEGG